jgi:dihydrofolate synthase/folylpolyglutamate synthase
MLRDKDLAGVLREVAPRITRWHFASLSGPRAATAEDLKEAFLRAGGNAPVELHASPREAFEAAREHAGENDKIVVFGSFLTVGEIIAWLRLGTSIR